MKPKLIRIKFVSNYADSNSLLERVYNQFDHQSIFNSDFDAKYKLTSGRKYDVLIVFNRLPDGFNDPIDKDKTFVFIQEPYWSPAFNNNNHADYSNRIYSPDPEKYINNKNFIYFPAIMFYHLTNPISELLNMKFEKTKKLSIVSSRSMYSPGHVKRTKFIESLLQRDDIDFDLYGYGWDGIHDSRYKGSPVNKIDALKDYRYSLAIENSNDINNYITEKFFDCCLTDTVPIYYGAKNINTIYNSDGFYMLDIENEFAGDRLNHILNHDLYRDMLMYVKENKYRYINEYTITSWIQKNI